MQSPPPFRNGQQAAPPTPSCAIGTSSRVRGQGLPARVAMARLAKAGLAGAPRRRSRPRERGSRPEGRPDVQLDIRRWQLVVVGAREAAVYCGRGGGGGRGQGRSASGPTPLTGDASAFGQRSRRPRALERCRRRCSLPWPRLKSRRHGGQLWTAATGRHQSREGPAGRHYHRAFGV